MERRRSDSFATRRNRSLKGVGIGLVGKSASLAETQQYQEASAEWIESVNRLPRKSAKHPESLRYPYRKPTQVVKERILRCSSESWLRN